jgi:integrase
LAEVTPTKKGWKQESNRLKNLGKSDIAQIQISKLRSQHLAEFRYKRLQDGQEAARYDLVLVQGVINKAMREWGLGIAENPLNSVTKPKPSRARDRRLSSEEYEEIIASAEGRCGGYLRPAIDLAIETDMRRSELLSVTWENMNLDAGLIYLLDTKNGSQRSVPLTRRAIEILNHLLRKDHRMLPLSDNAIQLGWKRLITSTGISDLRFHDLRHEAISRFFEMGLSVPEVALISGHKTPSQLFRYTNLKPENVVAKLA